MDRLSKSLDTLVKDGQKKAKQAKKGNGKDGKKVVKAAGGKKDAKGKVTKMKAPLTKKAPAPAPRVSLGKKKLPISARLGDKEGFPVRIDNLAYNIVTKDIMDLADTIGSTEAITVPKGKGYATVTFERKSDAMRAVKNFDGVTLDGRPMRVKLWSKEKPKSTQDSALLSRALLYGGATGSVKSKASTSTKSTKGKKEKDTKKAPAKKEKKDAKKKEKKPAAKKEEKKPVKSEDLDADMDSYFAAKAAKEEE